MGSSNVFIIFLAVVTQFVVSCSEGAGMMGNDQKDRPYSGKVTYEPDVPCIPPPNAASDQCFLDLTTFGLNINYPSDWTYLRSSGWDKYPEAEEIVGLRPRGQLVSNQFMIARYSGKTLAEVETLFDLSSGVSKVFEGAVTSTWLSYPNQKYSYFLRNIGEKIIVLGFHVGASYLEDDRDLMLNSLASYQINADQAQANQ